MTDAGKSGHHRSELRARLQEKLQASFADIELIGEGGMGSVFGAWDLGLDRRVAVKVLSPELATNPEARERFRREARALAALTHPNLVSVFSVDELPDGTPFFVMEYVGERSLADLINPATLVSITEAQRILEMVARGLLAIHERELVHRDIKPANILLDNTGRVLVSDFGIAVGENAEAERITTSRGLIGSPEYMSPEQASGDPIDHRSDLYSFGVMAFELLAGRRPFLSDTFQALIVKHITEDPPILSDLRPDCPPYLVQLVARCLEKERSVRYQSAEQILEILITAQEGGTLGTTTLKGEVAESRKNFAILLTASFVAAALDVVLRGDVAWSLIPLAASGVYGVSRAGRFWVDGLTAKGILGLEKTKFEALGSQSGRIQPFRQLVRQCRAERALLLSAFSELARSEQVGLPKLRGVVDHLVARASRSARELNSLRPETPVGRIGATGSGTYSPGRTKGEMVEAQHRLGEDVSGIVRLLREIRIEVAELGESGRKRGMDGVRTAVASAVAYLGDETLGP